MIIIALLSLLLLKFVCEAFDIRGQDIPRCYRRQVILVARFTFIWTRSGSISNHCITKNFSVAQTQTKSIATQGTTAVSRFYWASFQVSLYSNLSVQLFLDSFSRSTNQFCVVIREDRNENDVKRPFIMRERTATSGHQVDFESCLLRELLADSEHEKRTESFRVLLWKR